MSIQDINAMEGFSDGSLVEQLDRLLEKIPLGCESDREAAAFVAAEAARDGSPLDPQVWAKWAQMYLSVLRRNAEERASSGREIPGRYSHDHIVADAYASAAAGLDGRPWDDA
jgi:hypothetical protein